MRGALGVLVLLAACGDPAAPDAAVSDAGADASTIDASSADAGTDSSIDAGPARECPLVTEAWDVATGVWSSSFGWRGVFTPGDEEGGYLSDAVWYDGELVVGGSFTFAGPIRTSNVASWSLTAGWRALGDGLPDVVTVVAASADAIYAASGATASTIHRFRGGTWSAIGIADGHVDALEVDVDGSLLVGGQFLTGVDAIAVSSLASFREGTGWAAVSHVLGGRVTTIYRDAAGLCLGGWITGSPYVACRATPASSFVRHFMGVIGPVFGASVSALTRDSAGRLVAAGRFSLPGDPPMTASVAVLEAGTWSTVPPPLGSSSEGPSIGSLARAADGALWVAGDFSTLGDSDTATAFAYGLARFDRGAWREIGTLRVSRYLQTTDALVAGGEDVYAAGTFQRVVHRGAASVHGVARYTASGRWAALKHPGDPAHGPRFVTTLAAGGGCPTYIGAPSMATPGDEWTGIVARLDPDDGPVGTSPFELLDRWIGALAYGPDGTLYAGGAFDVGGRPALIARYRDGRWAPYGPFTNIADEQVSHLAVDDSGVLYAAGTLVADDDPSLAGLVRASGDVWASVGGRRPEGVSALVAGENGVCIAEAFDSTRTTVACWKDGVWTELGSPLDGTVHVLVEHEGDLVAGGFGLTDDSAVARWNGSSWESVGALALTGMERVDALASVGGALVAAGELGLGSNVAYFRDGTWTALAGGPEGPVLVMVTTESGLLLGGSFELADGIPSWGLARLEPR